MKSRSLIIIVFICLFCPKFSFGFEIEKLGPDVLSVSADGNNCELSSTGFFGCGQELNKAVIEIQKQYSILQITPIEYKLGPGNITKELLIIVKPKENKP